MNGNEADWNQTTGYQSPGIVADESDDTAEVPATAQPPVANVATAPIVAEEETLPDDLASALTLLTRLDNEPQQPTRKAERARVERLERVRRHAFNLQQVPPPPSYTADNQASEKIGKIRAVEDRATRLAKLQSIK
jgi:hypothetical protein